MLWRVAAASFVIAVLALATLPFMIPALGFQGLLGPNSPQSTPALSPCVPASPADISNSTIVPSSTNTPIPDFVPPSVLAQATPVSQMPQSFQLHLEFVFAIRNSTSFQSCLSAIQDPTSPYYRHFLSGASLQPYVPTPGQESSVISYFLSRGLAAKKGPSPLVLDVSGSVASLQSAFSTTIKLFGGTGGSKFYAPDGYPSMPANLAAMGVAIEGMDNYSRAAPAESPCSGPYCPQGIEVGYSMSSLLSAGHSGAGVTVGIVDEPGDQHIQNAVNTYDLQYSMPSITLSIVEPDGIPSLWDPGWASEAAMDVEAVHSAAPGASIVVLYGSGTDDPMSLIDYAATHHTANIISNSWDYDCTGGPCSDSEFPAAAISAYDSRLAIDSAQGLTILFASGDQGATPDGSSLGVEYPASDVNVLAVGATNLVLSGCGLTTCTAYASESGAVIGGGGYSGYFPEPSWQSAVVPSLPGRGVPDVSMMGYAPNFWVYSTLSDECGTTTTPQAGWFGCAGTSLATPLWAGVLAIVDQMGGGGLMGNIAPTIWQLAGSPFYSSDFHDITTGSNNDGHGGYPAASGWDPATGWGTPIASGLVNNAVTSTTITTNTITSTSTSTLTSITLATSTSTIIQVEFSISTTTNLLTATVYSISTTYVPISTTTAKITTTLTSTATATVTTTVVSTSTSTTTTSVTTSSTTSTSSTTQSTTTSTTTKTTTSTSTHSCFKNCS